jgi:hypothetical protein
VPQQIRHTIHRVHPDVILNAAAHTAVDSQLAMAGPSQTDTGMLLDGGLTSLIARVPCARDPEDKMEKGLCQRPAMVSEAGKR